MRVYDPMPEPLHSVLGGILHANLFGTWKSDLLAWDLDNPEAGKDLRRQIATCALTDAIDPERFQRFTGHDGRDVADTQAFFAEIFTEFYGRPPRPSDMDPQAEAPDGQAAG